MTPAHHDHVGDGGDEAGEDDDWKQDCRSELIAATVGLPRTVAGKRSRHLIHTPVFLLTATFSTLDLRLIREIRERQGGGRTRADNAFCPALSDGALVERQVDDAGSVDNGHDGQMDNPGRDLFG